MGNYTITIKGLGAHHNKDNKADADKMAFQFIHELREAGHSLSEASFLYSYKEDNLLKIGGVFTVNDAPKHGGTPIALTMEQIREIEQDKQFNDTGQSAWNNGNFRKLLETAKVLHSELEKAKSH